MDQHHLYKVVEIQGKDQGCIALEDIRKGTLILEEKPQIVAKNLGENPDGSDNLELLSIIEGFGHMNKIEIAEYLKLHNNFTDSDKVPDQWKLDYATIKQTLIEKNPSAFDLSRFGFVKEFILKQGDQGFIDVIGIYLTNTFSHGLGIQASKFNHSCCPNANSYWNEKNDIREIRAVSKIKKGEEIHISYIGAEGMMNLIARQMRFSSSYGFKCNCELCQSEVLTNNNERYEKFEMLKQEAKLFIQKYEQPSLTYQQKKDFTINEISCYRKMYKLVLFDPVSYTHLTLPTILLV